MGDAVNGLSTVDDPLGVGVLGHAPHTLDGGVLDGGLHGVHVRTGPGHGDGDQLHAEGLRQVEVAVIAGGRAQEFHRVQLAPGLLAVEQAVGVCLGNGVVHQGQAGVAADEALLRLAAQQLRKVLFRAGQACELPVVAHVEARLHAVLRRFQHGQHVADQIQLLFSGLSPGHVQLQILPLQLLEPLGDSLILRLELGCAHGLIFHRVFPPHSSPKGWYCPLLYYGSPQKASGQTAPFPT